MKSRPQGRAHRDKLRSEVLPRLRVGMMVPEAKVLSLLLGITGSEAARHMRRVLDEAGISTVLRCYGEGKRTVVASMPVRAQSGLSYRHYGPTP